MLIQFNNNSRSWRR